ALGALPPCAAGRRGGAGARRRGAGARHEPGRGRGADRNARRSRSPRGRPSADLRGRREPPDPERGRRPRRRRASRCRRRKLVPGVVLFERRGPAAWVTLNRPDKLNAISGEVVTRLRECWKLAIEDDEVKVVVLTGAGGAFSAGYHTSEEVER